MQGTNDMKTTTFKKITLVLVALFFIFGSIAFFFQEKADQSQSTLQTQNNVMNVMGEKNWGVGKEDPSGVTHESREMIQEFLNALLHKSHGTGYLGGYHFIDLNGDSTYELVASLDYSGRGFYNTIVIVKSKDDDFNTQVLTGWNVSDVSILFVDLDHDGIQELIMPTLLSDYKGAQCVALWTIVYTWNSDAYADASSSFPEVYQERIRILGEKIQKIEADIDTPKELKEQITSCYYMEKEKAIRFLGLDLSAGFDRADVWMNSPEVSLVNPDSFLPSSAIFARNYEIQRRSANNTIVANI